MPKKYMNKTLFDKENYQFILKYSSVYLYYKRTYITLKYSRIEIRIQYNSYNVSLK